MINKAGFYANVRKYFGQINNAQVLGFEAIINEFERQGLKNLHWLSYFMATPWHETNKTMQPIEEIGRGKGRKYGKKVRYNGQPYSVPDLLFFGRGHTQNTWIDVYEKLTAAAKKQGKNWDFVNHPELLLQMEPSIWAMFYAMQTGLYTGKKMADYFNGLKNDPVNARRIINLLDKAELIAKYHNLFYKCLTEK